MQLAPKGDLQHDRTMKTKEQTPKKQVQDDSPMAMLDVVLMGWPQKGGELLTFAQVADAGAAFSSIGQVFHQPACAAIVHVKGEVQGLEAHRLRIHVPRTRVLQALDTVHSYRELVLPNAYVMAEIANVMVVAL